MSLKIIFLFLGNLSLIFPAFSKHEEFDRELQRIGFTDHQIEFLKLKIGVRNPKKLRAVVTWLQGLGFSDSQVSMILGSYPALVACSIEKNLDPKWKLLSEEFAVTPEQIVEDPILLGASIPRLELLVYWAREVGVDIKRLEPAKKGELIHSGRVESIIRSFMYLLEWIRSNIADDEQRKEFITSAFDTLSEAGELYRVLIAKKKAIKNAFSHAACVNVFKNAAIEKGFKLNNFNMPIFQLKKLD